MEITVYIDGCCEPVNPGGIATYGIVIYEDNQKREFSGVVGEGKEMSNNVAEYAALCTCLQLLLSENKNTKEIIILSDSRLVVKQMKGEWECRGGLYVNKYKQALSLEVHFTHLSFQWISGELNKEADFLSRLAYIKYCQEKHYQPTFMRHRT